MLDAILALLAGLLLGSFLNVCIHRMPRDLSVVRPRSFCPECEKQIAWYDNIPVFSFLALRGRCRACGKPISWRYPAVEILTGATFFYIVLTRGTTPEAWKLCTFAALIIGLVFSDYEELILPDEFTLGGAVLGLAFAAWAPPDRGLIGYFLPVGWDPRLAAVVAAAMGAAFLSGLFWLVRAVYMAVRKKEGLGLGDVKMMAMLAAFLGLQGALMSAVLGAILGSVVGLTYIILSKKDAGTYELPFGTFLGVAALAYALFQGNLATLTGPLPR